MRVRKRLILKHIIKPNSLLNCLNRGVYPWTNNMNHSQLSRITAKKAEFTLINAPFFIHQHDQKIKPKWKINGSNANGFKQIHKLLQSIL